MLQFTSSTGQGNQAFQIIEDQARAMIVMLTGQTSSHRSRLSGTTWKASSRRKSGLQQPLQQTLVFSYKAKKMLPGKLGTRRSSCSHFLLVATAGMFSVLAVPVTLIKSFRAWSLLACLHYCPDSLRGCQTAKVLKLIRDQARQLILDQARHLHWNDRTCRNKRYAAWCMVTQALKPL